MTVADALDRCPRPCVVADRLVTTLMLDANWGVRLTATVTAVKRGVAGVERKVAARVRDPNWVVRCTAIEGLVELEATSSLKVVRAALADGNDDVRSYACWALGLLGNQSDANVLSEMLSNATWKLEVSARCALYRLGDGDALEPLSRLAVPDDMHAVLLASSVEDLLERRPGPHIVQDSGPLVRRLSGLVSKFPLIRGNLQHIEAAMK